jgi:hypothetical protein
MSGKRLERQNSSGIKTNTGLSNAKIRRSDFPIVVSLPLTLISTTLENAVIGQTSTTMKLIWYGWWIPVMTSRKGGNTL